jgi:DNA-binding LacI/PurR family transcriptional regulator
MPNTIRPGPSPARSAPLGTIRGGVTIEDVARQAGVSRQTVSNVINAPERVKPDTIAQVKEVIDSLGYRINRSARNLRTQQSRVIGYCLPPLTAAGNSVLDAFLHALVEAARGRGYHLLLVTAPHKADEVTLYWELAAQSAVDGVVFAQTDYNDPRPPALLKSQVPFVSFGRTWGATEHSWVDVDGEAGTRLATEHLLQLGHTQFAWIGHTDRSVGNVERERGVQGALADAGLDLASSLYVVDVDDDDRTVAHQLDGLLDSAIPPTAIVTVNDVEAANALAAIERHGLRPGRDVAVVGFDDSPVAAFVGGGLTSVRQPLDQVATELIRVLADQFDDPHAKPEGVLLKPELITRRSTSRE